MVQCFRNGLTQDPSNNDYAELLHDDEYNEASREERMYRAWINSQGCDTFVTSLFEDVRDGYVILTDYGIKCLLILNVLLLTGSENNSKTTILLSSSFQTQCLYHSQINHCR